MRWRQASESAHPEPILLRGNSGPAPDQRPSGQRNGPGRTPDPRIQDQPGRKRCLRTSALPQAQKELRLRRGRAGPGFGAGAANGHGPRASAHDHVRRNRGFGRGSCRTRLQRLRPAKPPGQGRGTRVPNPPSGEPPGLRPCAGSLRGNLKGLRLWTDSGGCGARTCPGYRPSKKPIAKGLLRRNRTRRDSGGRQRCRPPLLSGGRRAEVASPASHLCRHSSASWNPASPFRSPRKAGRFQLSLE